MNNGFSVDTRRSVRRAPSFISRPTQLLLDAGAAALAVLAAYSLRFDFEIPAPQRFGMWIWLIFIAVAHPAVLLLTRGYNSTWRYFSFQDALRLAYRSLAVTSGLLIARILAHRVTVVPYSVLVLEFCLFLSFAGLLRVARRLGFESLSDNSSGTRTLIIGNGSALAGAVRHVQSDGNACIVGLVTEDVSLLALRIAGVPVLGLPSSLPSILMIHRIGAIVLSGSDFEGSEQVMRTSSELGVELRILPSLGDLMEGRVKVSRVVSVEEISRRHELAKTNGVAHLVPMECFRGKTALVTGAGGSIGSELARQIVDLSVDRLLVLDHEENSIFELMSQLSMRSMEIVPIIGDIRDRQLVRHVFDHYRPDIVLHAAAYKHVGMMEMNCFEAVLNNVSGTRELADAAIEFKCERMVMISSDKAVHPTSVMGATKRVAELLIQQRAEQAMRQHHKTQFACVRFGNVLGSRGSVVPIFLRQIAAGGPVTITNEEMTRYFMTIPQAVHLVLQAATLASFGDVYMLDMGDPVKIIDFAKEIIGLSGLVPGKDIEIKVIGTRPGEKVHEQLWKEDALVSITEFTQILHVKAAPVPQNLTMLLEDLERAGRERQSEDVIRSLLCEMPIDYQTEHHEVGPFAVSNTFSSASMETLNPAFGSQH